jgi:hypothetical protein
MPKEIKTVKASLGKMRRMLREQRGQHNPFRPEKVKLKEPDYHTPTMYRRDAPTPLPPTPVQI